VIAEGRPVPFLERSGKKVVTFTNEKIC
jgi:hypothetical protein